MNTDVKNAPVTMHGQASYARAVINSSLWAAAGDAIGWMTELSRGPDGVKRRTGKAFVSEPVVWLRVIGGRSGVKVELPPGTYSDDTQLRLCVSRAIRGNGAFDVEAFAKIEVTAWQGYCLGAGVGSKAAAANLSKRGVNWFSNFFSTDRQKYATAGGNGAAMRIQPHVWSAKGTLDEMILRVMRDSIVTHGHPHGFCGAVFHALCLWETLATHRIPSMKKASQFVSYLEKLATIIDTDNELSSFWKPSWERASNCSFESAIKKFQDEAFHDISLVEASFNSSPSPNYHGLLDKLGCLTDKYRGSGFKTALAAQALSLLHSPENITDALVQSANELESDTDTIATMAGALLGALKTDEPNWNIQDIGYLRSEAQRMANIAQGSKAPSFSYPDVSSWEPPTNQSNAVGLWKGNLALTGIGVLASQGKEYTSGNSVWQWLQLPHGQSILAKRRSKNLPSVNDNQMPGEPFWPKAATRAPNDKVKQNSFEFDKRREHGNEHRRAHNNMQVSRSDKFPGLDKATDIVISSGFDNATIGRLINQCIDDTGSVELAVGFSAIIAKARLVRVKRR